MIFHDSRKQGKPELPKSCQSSFAGCVDQHVDDVDTTYNTMQTGSDKHVYQIQDSFVVSLAV